MKSLSIKIILVVLLIAQITQSASAMTLLEAIQVSLENNPKLVANENRIEAAEDRLKASRLDWVPDVRIGAGYNFNQSDQNPVSQSRNVGVGASLNIYDGGARTQNLIAEESDLEARKDRNNTTNPFTRNTRASIAGSVLNTYVSVLSIVEEKKYANFSENTLKTFLKAAVLDTEVAIIKQQLEVLKTQNTRLDFRLAQAQKDFKRFTTVALPPLETLQSLDEVIRSLGIPANESSAKEIALVKNPDIKVAARDLKSARARYEAQKASYGPQVSVNVSAGRGGSRRGGENFESSTTKTIGFNVSMQFDVGRKYSLSASQKSIEAAANDNSAEIEDAKYEIERIYSQMQNQTEIYKVQVAALRVAQERLQLVLNKIKNGEFVEIKDEALFSLQVYSGYSTATLIGRTEILNSRFAIQQAVGTLFDNLNKNASTSELFVK